MPKNIDGPAQAFRAVDQRAAVSIIVPVAVLVLVLATACAALVQMASAPPEHVRDKSLNQARNETLFLAQVKRYFAAAPAKARRVTDAIYVAEGDHACRWLSRESPVITEAPQQTSYELYRRYVRTVDPTPIWPFGRRGVRGDVIYNAWNFLCPNLRDSRTWTPPPEAD